MTATGSCDHSDLGDLYVVVTRHPRSGREIEAFGGSRRFRGKDVLDIGTGDGRLAFDAARLARRVVAIDPNTEAIAAARARAAALGIGSVGFHRGDATGFDLGQRRFDVAIFSWSL